MRLALSSLALSALAYPVLGLSLLAQPSLAFDLPESTQIHGFAALNPLLTTANNFFGNTEDNVSLEFWEVGINGSWRPTSDLLLSAQVTSRRAGNEDDGAPRLDYGLVSYTFVNDSRLQAGIRVGRILNPLGLYNETRDVAFTRNSILLPQSIYFDRTRDLALSSDGGQLFGRLISDFGDFFLQANFGDPRTDDDGRAERSLLGMDGPGGLDGRPSALVRLLYERDGGRWVAALSGGTVGVRYDAKGPADPFGDGEATFKPIIFSLQHNAEKYSLTTEFGPRIFESEGFGRPDNTTTGESFYAEGLYRFTPKWEGFLRYDVLITDRDDRNGRRFAANDPLRRPDFSRFAKDWTAGLNWRVNKSLLLRAEYHYVNGTAWLPIADNRNRRDLERYWSIFAFQAAIRF
jgi:hypothetical protein